jgi:hypothetical protein
LGPSFNEKSVPSPGKIRIFFKHAAGQAAIWRQLSSHAGGRNALSPAFFQVFPPCKDRHSQCGFWGAARNRKRKNRMVAATDGVARKSATDVDELVQAEPRKGFVRFMDALRETRRRQARREIAKNAHLLSDDFWRQLDLWRNVS